MMEAFALAVAVVSVFLLVVWARRYDRIVDERHRRVQAALDRAFTKDTAVR